MKKTFFTFILLVAVLVAGNATADPIDGTIGFFGTYSPTGGTGVLGDATGVAFPSDLWVSYASGDFSSVYGLSAAFSSFTFENNVLSPSPVYSLWQVPPSLPSAFSFDLYSISVLQQDNLSLVLNGSGVLHGTGFDDTAGTWTFVGNSGSNINFSFSSDASMPIPTSTSVPDPSAMVLLGSACLFCFIGTRRKRV